MLLCVCSSLMLPTHTEREKEREKEREREKDRERCNSSAYLYGDVYITFTRAKHPKNWRSKKIEEIFLSVVGER